jgi:hypothetical protein
MKKLITSITIVILFTIFLSACKKPNDPPATLTTLQKIQAKWQIETYAENDYYSGADHIQNKTGSTSDYLDFRADGKVYVSLFGTKDTSTYTLSGETKIIIDGASTYDIKTLTSNSFTIYQKDISGSDFFEQTFTMKK